MIRLVIKGQDSKSLLAQVQDLGSATDAFEAAVIAWLRDRDFAVHKNGPWETPTAMAARLGVSVKHICRRRKHPRCPQHGVEYAPGSEQIRVQAISSNPALDAFIQAHIQTAVNAA
jgi:hypothetical protein